MDDSAFGPVARRIRRVLPLCGALVLLVAGMPAELPAQSLLERTPNLGGTWVGESGTLHFHFLHRFEATSPPTRKVVNTPTFLLAASLPGRTLVGARYATSSLVAPGFPNEWEFFGRLQGLNQEEGAPLDAVVHAAYNQAASSFDGEVTVGRTLGSIRVLGIGRAFSDAYRSGESRLAAGGGLSLRLHEFVAVGGDVATLLDREDAEEVAWSAGVQLRIPYTPHTLSLQASNANTTTLQGASVGLEEMRWGFEFTIPLTLSRYFGGGNGEASATAAAPTATSGTAATGETASSGAAADAPLVTMTNRLTFEPASIRIKAGQSVTFRNTSDIVHTVTADPSKAAKAASVSLPEGAEPFDSGDLKPGEEFTYTFSVPGSYGYFCIPHEMAGMVGTVIVEAS